MVWYLQRTHRVRKVSADVDVQHNFIMLVWTIKTNDFIDPKYVDFWLMIYRQNCQMKDAHHLYCSACEMKALGKNNSSIKAWLIKYSKKYTIVRGTMNSNIG